MFAVASCPAPSCPACYQCSLHNPSVAMDSQQMHAQLPQRAAEWPNRQARSPPRAVRARATRQGRPQQRRRSVSGDGHLRLELQRRLQLGGDGGGVRLALPLQLHALQQRGHGAVLHHPRLRTQLPRELCAPRTALCPPPPLPRTPPPFRPTAASKSPTLTRPLFVAPDLRSPVGSRWPQLALPGATWMLPQHAIGGAETNTGLRAQCTSPRHV